MPQTVGVNEDTEAAGEGKYKADDHAGDIAAGETGGDSATGRSARVFGSVPTGENRPDSDVDILVDLEPGRTLFDLGALLEDLRDLLAAKVDVMDSRCIHPISVTGFSLRQ